MKPAEVASAIYGDCMRVNVRVYAKKASTADEAILAAQGACNDEREILRITAKAQLLSDSKGQPWAFTDERASDGAEQVLTKLEEALKPRLVQLVLDAK